VLDLSAGRRWFDSATYPAPPDLAELVEHFWMVRWDVRGHEPYPQHTLSNASVHLCFEAGNSRIQGVVTGRFTRLLEDEGRVFGVKFRPAGFRPFLGSPVSTVTDASLPVAAVFGPAGDALVERMLALADGPALAGVAGAFLGERRPELEPVTAEINRAVAMIVADRSIIRVDQVAERVGLGRRTLQRLFHEHVGGEPEVGHPALPAARGGRAAGYRRRRRPGRSRPRARLLRPGPLRAGTSAPSWAGRRPSTRAERGPAAPRDVDHLAWLIGRPRP